MNVRPMTAADLPAVLDIERRSFSTPWTQEHFEAELKKQSEHHGAALVIEDGGRVFAYACASGAAEDWDLQVIAVAERERGKGVARRLIGHVFAAAKERGVEAMFLEVRESNEPAKRLYDRAGFEVVGRRRGYFKEPVEDALIYRVRVV